jgi:Protein of unknown function (DUF2750)
MTWAMRDKEFESVLALPGDRRYAYFIKRVADWELVYSLAADDGWALAGDDGGHELLPIWPHERFAAACTMGNWAGYQPRSIEASDWMELWLPGLVRDHRLVAVFPTPASHGVVVRPDRLKDDLQAEPSI